MFHPEKYKKNNKKKNIQINLNKLQNVKLIEIIKKNEKNQNSILPVLHL